MQPDFFKPKENEAKVTFPHPSKHSCHYHQLGLFTTSAHSVSRCMGDAIIALWLITFGDVVLSCFTISRSTFCTEVSPVKSKDSPHAMIHGNSLIKVTGQESCALTKRYSGPNDLTHCTVKAHIHYQVPS